MDSNKNLSVDSNVDSSLDSSLDLSESSEDSSNLDYIFKIIYSAEKRGFAPYKNENDHFIRILAQKIAK
ncbi:hypothetical protein CCY99_06270 [Helicobacter sp. 16-1353]|nr:hypothetical protein CCY99_06270 [Helicobacter sp. 16-1353]